MSQNKFTVAITILTRFKINIFYKNSRPWQPETKLRGDSAVNSGGSKAAPATLTLLRFYLIFEFIRLNL